VPGFAVRVKTGAETAEAIEWAADPAARPAIKKPAVAEEYIAKLLLSEAERLKGEGWTMLRDVIEAMKNEPESPETLKPLFLNLETATALLTKSREVYLLTKEKASDSASIDDNLSMISRVLEIAARHTESIKSRLK
ncbi:MAG: hypothetical protein HY293_10565, partial [Planctomycetes bacterium]|nr:hypothetical protein [Planctomycetota bacterium]